MSSVEQMTQWREDLEELGTLRARDGGHEYHDDDLAFIERAYSSFFAAIKEVEWLRLENELLKVPDPKPDEPLGDYLQRCAVTRNESS